MNNSIYNHHKSFEFNAVFGPFWEKEMPEIAPTEDKYDFLGHQLNSRFGVPSCALLGTPRYVQFFSQMGYDLLTYKTARSVQWIGHDHPNWIYVDLPHQLTADQLSDLRVTGGPTPFPNQEVSTANSFGVASPKPQYWQTDFDHAQSLLQPGQLLILSLMTSPLEERNQIADAEKLAHLALQTSASVIELNLACPNTTSSGLIYTDIEASADLCKAMKNILQDKKLIVKVGYYQDYQDLRAFLTKTKDHIDGIASTNTYSMKIVDQKGEPAFFNRDIAGVSGAAIRDLCQEQIKEIAKLKKELSLKEEFVILGIGGVTKDYHIDQYLDLGADFVQSAAGVWANPLLAAEYKNSGPIKGVLLSKRN